MDAFFGKFSDEIRSNLGQMHGVLWESDKVVSKCRYCNCNFTLLKRKHHCRGCGGIFCENCTFTNTFVNGSLLPLACKGCIDLETPGEIITKLAEQHLLKETDRKKIRKQGFLIRLHAGSKFLLANPSDVAPPSKGYFEFCNKSDSPIAIKLLQFGSDYLWEAPRPSYIPIPANEAVHGEFAASKLDIIILTSYPVHTYNDVTVLSDPKNIEINKFRDFCVFSTNCENRNVLLKYKGFGIVEPRHGSILPQSVGLFSKLTGSPTSPRSGTDSDKIDFQTNVTDVETLFKSFT